jgi:glycosyltransferase involved in cell wall biosynthesis
MIKVSIVVPVFNVEKYLKKSIECVQKQTVTDWEMILVDDGSTDRSGEICDCFEKDDKRIRVIHKKNSGQSDARNIGIQYAQGEYLYFMDSDDSIAPNLLEETVKKADEKKADIVMFDFITTEEKTGASQVYKMSDIPRNLLFSLEKCPQIIFAAPGPCNKLYRRDYWNSLDLSFPSGRIYEDLSLIPRTYVNTDKILYIQSDPLYNYLRHEGSTMTNKQYKRNYDCRTMAMDDIIRYYTEKRYYDKVKTELEFLAFDNIYFQPSKEIVLNDRKSPYLKKFRQYIDQTFPEYKKNKYIKTLSGKDRILLFLLQHRQYRLMQLMSILRKMIVK